MGTFAVDLAKFGEKVARAADDVVGDVVVQIAATLDLRSPVGDATYWKSKPPPGYVGGRFRGNWQLGVDSIPSGETGRIDTIGGPTLNAIIAEIPTQAAGKTYWLANNVPYGPRIEDGTGSPRQAPNGVVGLTEMEFPQMVDQAVAAVQ